MKKSIVGIYALAVCFVIIVCAVIAAGIGAYDLVEIASPEFALSSYEYERHQSNESFFQSDCEQKNSVKLTEEEKTKRRVASYDTAIKVERRDAIQSLIIVLIVLSIDASVFFAHWKLACRSQEASNAT